MKKYLVFFFPIFIFLYSCQQETTFNNQEADSLFTIKVAHYMEEAKELNPNATLQFQDTYREVYLIVLHEEKGLEELTLEEYYKYTKDKLEKNSLKNKKFTDPSKKEVNGNQIMQAEFTGTLSYKEDNETQEIGVFYIFQVVESPTDFYQIYTWTKAEQREKYQKDMQNMLDSFKEL